MGPRSYIPIPVLTQHGTHLRGPIPIGRYPIRKGTQVGLAFPVLIVTAKRCQQLSVSGGFGCAEYAASDNPHGAPPARPSDRKRDSFSPQGTHPNRFLSASYRHEREETTAATRQHIGYQAAGSSA